MAKKKTNPVNIEALKEDASAWRDFVWKRVSSYWIYRADMTQLNWALRVASEIDRYEETVSILKDVSAHSIDRVSGLFRKGVNKQRRDNLRDSWQRILADRIGHGVPSGGPTVLKRLHEMSILETVRLWKNFVTYLSEERYRARWDDSRLVIQAINQEWARRQVELPESDDFFEWPDIDARGGDGSLTAHWLEEGLLSYMGYHVGSTRGVSATKRQYILREIFGGVVPPIFPRSYVDSWGKADSSSRLKKMAETVAALIRNATRRRSAALEMAINQWSDDLEFLYYEFYIGKFGFAWPKIRD